MEYKAVYTQEEVAELLEWFEQHSDRLPESMALGVEMNIPDVRKTVEAYSRMARVHGEDRKNGTSCPFADHRHLVRACQDSAMSST